MIKEKVCKSVHFFQIELSYVCPSFHAINTLVMFRKNILILFWVLATNVVFANFAPAPSPCDLPAPESVACVEKGPTWLKVEWVSLNLGVQHRIKTYKLIGNVLVSNLLAPAGVMSIVIQGLQPGILYYSTVSAICPDGTDSNNLAYSGPESIILSELVVSGFTPTAFSATCGISTEGQFCTFFDNKAGNFFQIIKLNQPNIKKQFKLSHFEGKLRAQLNDNEGDYRFTLDDVGPNTTGSIFKVSYLNNLIATFELSECFVSNPKVGKIRCLVNFDVNFQIQRLGNGPSGFAPPPPGSIALDRSEQPNSEHYTTASPNPFSESLDVSLGQLAQSQVRLQLFNLNGQVVVDRRFEPGRDYYTLLTLDIAPGFYFLRIEADGEVQTLKVIKSE